MTANDTDDELINCPGCGEPELRRWVHKWVIFDEVTLLADGTVMSYGGEDDDVTESFYACDSCNTRWMNEAELVAAHRKATESA